MRPRPASSSAKNAAHTTRALALDIDLSALAIIERLLIRAPVRFLRARNNALDQLFYDVDTIPPAWRRKLLEWSDPDGSIVVVYPGSARERRLEHFEQLDRFLEWLAPNDTCTVALAGVGSSALGTAALAANIADMIRKPVVGVVSGYGVADALTEGLVGWFVLRPSNQLRQLFDTWLSLAQPLLAAISAQTQPNGDPRRLVTYVRGLPETDALDALLRLPDTFVATLVGHSKGNLDIAAALGNLSDKKWRELTPKLSVVTLGALVQLPPTLKSARQLIGMLDGFGLANSILPQLSTVVPWATHTLNTRWPFHLDAAQAFANGDGAAIARAWSAFAETITAPAAMTLQWIDACAGAATAFQGAVRESVRSIQQGAQHAAQKARVLA